MDDVLVRSSDPALIALARDPQSFEGVLKLPDGTAFGPRWVVTPQGVQVGFIACAGCHYSQRTDGTIEYGGPGGPSPSGTPRLSPRGSGGAAATIRGYQAFFVGDSLGVSLWRQWSTPWAPDERIEKVRGMSAAEIPVFFRADPGTFPRPHGSPYYATKTPDLRLLRYYRYIDATGTHRLRGPEDIARYAALITGADPMEFGKHRLLTDEQRHVRFRYADEVLYAIGMYLLAQEPPKNPNPAPREILDRGEQIFRREGCVNCHVPPAYTSGKLTLAHGWKPESGHPNVADVNPVSVGTDPGLALKTRKGTGFYKIPSLRGVWYRPRLLHDASFTSLEEMFDAARLSPTYTPKGWNPPGVTERAVTGHQFGIKLDPRGKAALMAFLRSL